jgi:CheY-like chemotaxis protein
MILDYYILWIEDSETFIDSLQSSLSRHLEAKGFISHITTKASLKKSEVAQQLKKNDYSLILMDYDLGDENAKGNELIDIIRQENIGVEIIFYSAHGVNRLFKLIYDDQIGGVYCADRRDLGTQTKEIIDYTLEKIEDINNMRGLVLAEVSDHDYIMCQVIDDILNRDNGNLENIFEYVKNKIILTKQIDVEKKVKKEIESIGDLCVNIDDSRVYNISDKLKILSKFRKSNKIELEKTFVSSYTGEVVHLRNILAHVKEEVQDDGNRVLKSPQGATYSKDDFTSIRKTLSTYRQRFEELLKKAEESG